MTHIDGLQLHAAFSSGARKLRSVQSYLDSINVFPVPDGDTGSNMAATITYAVEQTQADASVSNTLSSLADAALTAARGNSGVILAQFIAGFGESLADKSSINQHEFVKAVGDAYLSAKTSMSDPQEGTILSVIEAWSVALMREVRQTRSFRELFRATHPDLMRSLAATTGQLEALKRAHVVDAGASGFVAFVDGTFEFFESTHPGSEVNAVQERIIHPRLPPDVPAPILSGTETVFEEPGSYRYCTEFIVEGHDIDRDALRKELAFLGDSLIVTGSGGKVRVHIHTDDPSRVRRSARARGKISQQKVDDMRRQYQDAHSPVSSIAIVTDSACDLSLELADRYRIHTVPVFIRAGDEEYLDRLTIHPSQVYDLVENSSCFPKTSQPTAKMFERLYGELLERYKNIISIHTSSRLSGTFETAVRAARSVDSDRIKLIDSRHLSGSLGLIVVRTAIELENHPDSIDSVLEKLPEWCDKAENLVSVRTLDFMVKGGRVSRAGGAIASFLNLKPIVSVDKSGASKLYGNAFSVAGNLRKIQKMVENFNTKSPLLWYAIVHAQEPAGAMDMARRLERILGFPPLYIDEISAVVGLNAGRGAVSVVTMAR